MARRFVPLLLVLSFPATAPAPASVAGEPDFSAARTDLSPEDLKRAMDVTRPTGDFTRAEAYEAMQAGAATSIDPVDGNAFSHPSANLTSAEAQDFKLGRALFRKLWVSSPSSTQASDGLGPLFNARSCQSCHVKGGRGRPPVDDPSSPSLILRLARGPKDEAERRAIANHEALNFPDPTYGAQLQTFAVPGLAAEGRMEVRYEEQAVTLGDGESVSLRKPVYSIEDPTSGPLDLDTTLSPRIAPPMPGLGLIAAIPDADILARADPDDADGDGISGRPQVVRDRRTGAVALGRFGWKAKSVTVRDQTAAAFSSDLGISTPDLPDPYGDCTGRQPQCLARETGVQARLGDTEAPGPILDLVTFYSENLAVPARRKAHVPEVLRGKQLFYASGCISCHTPKYVTRRDAGNKAQAFQLIWPYSDFLLHDMGDGLADGQAEGVADGGEWRTPPLWGIGLTKTVSGDNFFLHDGRARTLTEAVLWHGGEGQKARDRFASLPKDDRQTLITFLESL